MAIRESQRKAVARYKKKSYDRIDVNVPKGKKEEIQAHAQARGESINHFVNRAIDETMERDLPFSMVEKA